MKAIISSFRRAKHNYKPRHYILLPEAKDKKSMEKLIGKQVIWKAKSGKEIKGKVTSLHGKHAVRCIMESGLPGQAVASEVEIK